MNKEYNVLVTGVGAIIGYGILKSLPDNCYVVGADIYPDAVGQHWSDKFIQAPYTNHPSYTNWLRNVIEDNKIDIVFPGIEQDVHFLAANKDKFKDLPCKFVLNKVELIEITKNKFDTYNYLKDAFPDNVILSLDKTDYKHIVSLCSLPFILKPKKSYASKGIVKIENQKDFDYWIDKNDYIAQPIVGDDDSEYTVSVFADGKGDFGPMIALKRKLSKEGSTAKAETYFDDKLVDLLKKMCAFLKPIGPTNFQFRKDNETYKLLEINPRISSATSIRKAFCYNESEMCIDFFLENKHIDFIKIKTGKAQRFIDDCITYNSFNI